MVVAEFKTNSGDNVKVYSDGDVYVNGRMDSKIYPDGEIWYFGKVIAKIYHDGEIWSEGYRVGKIYLDGEIWVGQTCVARVNDGHCKRKLDTSISNSNDIEASKNTTKIGMYGGSSLPSGDISGDGCVIFFVAIYLVLVTIVGCFGIWKFLFQEIYSESSISEMIEMIMVIVSAIITMIIQYCVNRKGKGGYGYFINLAGMLIVLMTSMLIEEGKIHIGITVVLSCLFAALPTGIIASICWVINRMKSNKKSC